MNSAIGQDILWLFEGVLKKNKTCDKGSVHLQGLIKICLIN